MSREWASQKQRNQDIVNLYLSGHTLRRIGKQYDLSHERIRQILYRAKVDAKQGGYALASRQLREARELKLKELRVNREQQIQKIYGLSYDEYKQIKREYGSGVLRIYQTKRNNHISHGRVFNLTFGQWCEFWGEDWKNPEKISSYLLCRIDRSLPYQPGNLQKKIGRFDYKR